MMKNFMRKLKAASKAIEKVGHEIEMEKIVRKHELEILDRCKEHILIGKFRSGFRCQADYAEFFLTRVAGYMVYGDSFAPRVTEGVVINKAGDTRATEMFMMDGKAFLFIASEKDANKELYDATTMRYRDIVSSEGNLNGTMYVLGISKNMKADRDLFNRVMEYIKGKLIGDWVKSGEESQVQESDLEDLKLEKEFNGSLDDEKKPSGGDDNEKSSYGEAPKN